MYRSNLLRGFSFVACVMFCAPVTSHAEAQVALPDFFATQLNVAQEAVCAEEAAESSDLSLTRFFLNLSPSVSVGIKGFSSASVAPEIEFVWEKAE